MPAPGPKGWCKQVVRGMLRNELYVGVAIYGQDARRRLRAAASGSKWPPRRPTGLGSTSRRAASSPTISGGRSRPERPRRAATTAGARTASCSGRPEAGLVATHLLNGFPALPRVRRGHDGHVEGARTKRQPLLLRDAASRRGTCTNRRGILVRELDAAVQAALNAKLTRTLSGSCARERAARLQRERAGQGRERANAERELKKLEVAVARLLRSPRGRPGRRRPAPAAAGRAGGAQGEARGVTRPRPQPRDAARRACDGFASISAGATGSSTTRARTTSSSRTTARPGLTLGPPVQVRQALRRAGVERIVVKPDGDGWSL